MISVLETITPEGRVTEILRHEGCPGQERLEAPNWCQSGAVFLVNSGGRLWLVPLDQPRLLPLGTGLADRCNNDHGFTADGLILFGSHYEGQGAQIYAVSRRGIAAGEAPAKVSPAAPSWLHGVAPDNRRLLYAAVRGENPAGRRAVDICLGELARDRGPGTISEGILSERQLTHGEGHNDGPDFSHDGRQIYWNSDRSGHAQIWVMDVDGQNQRQLFADDRVNWFPHPSPCGRWLCWLSYPPGTPGHPADLPVRLMISDPAGQNRRILREFTGGQGTINVPSWAADGQAFAYIRYE